MCEGSIREIARAAIAGGADVIQLREKDVNDDECLAMAAELRELTDETGRILLINDRPDIAAIVGADGVHLGQHDLPIAEARRLLRPGAIVGRSTHSLAQAQAAVAEGADYIAVGPIFATATKDAGPAVGTGPAARSGRAGLPAHRRHRRHQRRQRQVRRRRRCESPGHLRRRLLGQEPQGRRRSHTSSVRRKPIERPHVRLVAAGHSPRDICVGVGSPIPRQTCRRPLQPTVSTRLRRDPCVHKKGGRQVARGGRAGFMPNRPCRLLTSLLNHPNGMHQALENKY